MRIKIFFLLLLITELVIAQESYYILHVKGQVKSGERVLKIKDKISADESLTFSSESALLVVFSNQSGKKVIKPVEEAGNSTGLLTFFVNENILPAQNQLSTRGTDEMSSFSDLKKYFSSPVLVIDTLSLTLNKVSLNINENNSLVFSSKSVEVEGFFYQNNWNTTINKLSEFENESVELSFIDKGFGSKIPICEVSLITKTFNELKEEIDFFAEVSGKSFDEISLKDHIETVYGRFNTDYLPRLLQ